jgi:hypothetical protein
MVKFNEEAIYKHFAKHHPGCPEFAVRFFVNEISSRDWKNVSLGKAVGICLQTVLRHQMTDYDQLLLCGVQRNEARNRVQPRINAMIASWAKPAAKRSANQE